MGRRKGHDKIDPKTVARDRAREEMNVTPGARSFYGVTFVAIGAFVSVALVTGSPRDWPFDPSASMRAVENLSGPLGSLFAWAVVELLGRAFAWLFPFALLTLGFSAIAGGTAAVLRMVARLTAAVLLLNALFVLIPVTNELSAFRGRVGDGVASVLSLVIGDIGASIVLVAALLLLFLSGLGRLFSGFSRLVRGGFKGGLSVRGALSGLKGGVVRTGRFTLGALGAGVAGVAGLLRRAARPKAVGEASDRDGAVAAVGDDEPLYDSQELDEPESRQLPIEIVTAAKQRSSPAAKSVSPGEKAAEQKRKKPIEEASLPPLSIFEHGQVDGASYSKETLRNWSGILEEKLGNYGIEGKVTSVHHGPVVTTFELEPARGVRIKDIVSRADDLALAMRARSLRMIAPIPGRAAVGIEIPNPESRVVYLYDVLSEVSESQRLRGIMIAIGVDVDGKPFVMNLCDAPHLLIAGTTGSGKSVCLNAILSCILCQYRPSDVKIILVDPKMVEMATYNGLPHLLHPVITDPKEAAHVLEYLTAEMTRRNELFRKHGVKNIDSFNSKISLGKAAFDDEPPERLPYIVLIVDELGDLAVAKGVDIESLLARLAQMARAAGIHMVLSTQRPSVDVIVGKTKANFPTRIAFRVATKVDSRTILDTIGADKLLGKGDMLYTDARYPQPLRLHGAWVTEQNVEDLISHWKSYQFEESRIDLHLQRAGAAQLDDNVDPLFGEAKGVVIRYRQGSTSLLQRKLHIGYARAARLLDQLEVVGVVGPPDGSKPREVYEGHDGGDGYLEEDEEASGER